MKIIPVMIENYPQKRIFHIVIRCGKVKKTTTKIIQCDGVMKVLKAEQNGDAAVVSLCCSKCEDDLILRINEV